MALVITTIIFVFHIKGKGLCSENYVAAYSTYAEEDPELIRKYNESLTQHVEGFEWCQDVC